MCRLDLPVSPHESPPPSDFRYRFSAALDINRYPGAAEEITRMLGFEPSEVHYLEGPAAETSRIRSRWTFSATGEFSTAEMNARSYVPLVDELVEKLAARSKALAALAAAAEITLVLTLKSDSPNNNLRLSRDTLRSIAELGLPVVFCSYH